MADTEETMSLNSPANLKVGKRYEYTRIGSAEQKYYACTVIGFDDGAPVIKTDAGHYHRRPTDSYRFRKI